MSFTLVTVIYFPCWYKPNKSQIWADFVCPHWVRIGALAASVPLCVTSPFRLNFIIIGCLKIVSFMWYSLWFAVHALNLIEHSLRLVMNVQCTMPYCFASVRASLNVTNRNHSKYGAIQLWCDSTSTLQCRWIIFPVSFCWVLSWQHQSTKSPVICNQLRSSSIWKFNENIKFC